VFLVLGCCGKFAVHKPVKTYPVAVQQQVELAAVLHLGRAAFGWPPAQRMLPSGV
jgi:hypothetical protein